VDRNALPLQIDFRIIGRPAKTKFTRSEKICSELEEGCVDRNARPLHSVQIIKGPRGQKYTPSEKEARKRQGLRGQKCTPFWKKRSELETGNLDRNAPPLQ
jgi:hypothetical protein